MGSEPRCTLYIKDSGCYLCQRVHMIVLLKGLFPETCRVVEVPEKQKLKFLNDNCVGSTMLPVLKDGEVEYEDGEEIEAHLEKHFTERGTYPSLISDDAKVNKLTGERSPISDFNKWIRTDNPVEKHADNIAKFLREADNILGENAGKGKFLDGNELKLPDCILLPKLYHMRMVGKHITKDKGDIFKGYTNLERYMKNAEDGTAFEKTKKGVDTTKWDQFKLKNKNSKDIAVK